MYLFKVRYETQLGLNTSNLPREKWDTWDPTLISEVSLHLFTIFSLKFLFHKTFVNQPKSELDFQYNGNVKSTKFCGVSKNPVSFLLQSTINLFPILGLRQRSPFCKGSFSLYLFICVFSVLRIVLCLVYRAFSSAF